MTVSSCCGTEWSNGRRFAAAMINAAVAAMDLVHRMMDFFATTKKTMLYFRQREKYLVLGYRAGAKFQGK
jgi:hypothetical protein